METFAEWTGGKLDRGGPTYKKEEQKKVTVIKTPKGKKIHAKHMKEKLSKERKEREKAKAEYYHKTSKKPLLFDLPGVVSHVGEKVDQYPFDKKASEAYIRKQKKIAAEYGQPIVKYKKGGTVKKTYAYGGRIRKAKYTKE
jgi:hypothetical protein